MEPQVIWIKIDPNLLIEGFDCQAFFGVDSFLKFNINPDETENNDKERRNANLQPLNYEQDTTFKGEVEDIKIEQNIKSEFDQHLSPAVKPNNRQGIPSVCSECGFKVGSIARLKEHVAVVHNTDLRFPCDHCDKKFLRKSLLSHKRFIVEKELKVSCEICKGKHDTKNHREPVAQCKNCSKSFTTKKNFDLHMLQVFCDPARCEKIRLDRKTEALRSGQFKCTFEKCEKLYLNRSHLERHIMIHTNERPFQCDNCGRAFHQEGSLKEHVRVHTGEKPYQCQICPNAYAQGGTFKNHLKTHTEAKTSPDYSEVKTSKSKDANFRDYYLNGTFLETKPYSGRGRPPNLKTHNNATNPVPDKIEVKT